MHNSGTTSACAENTFIKDKVGTFSGNYLRVRGEYAAMASQAGLMMELPPRARRIPQRASSCQKLRGTTSACAENTEFENLTRLHRVNYLRVRGEYTYTGNIYGGQKELPPRARRIPGQAARSQMGRGTTSACAENTRMVAIRCPAVRNYLRVRGEYTAKRPVSPSGPELPPRARRILDMISLSSGHHGTTSACAENT